MSRKALPLFVERDTYRKRRMIDAARILPILGVALLVLPVLWQTPDGQGLPTTYLMGYIFGVWVLLAAAAAGLSAYLAARSAPDEDPPEAQG